MIIALTLALLADTQAADPAAERIRLALAASNQASHLPVVAYSDGTPNTIIGSFDVGATPQDLSDGTRLAALVKSFLVAHPDVYGTNPQDLTVTAATTAGSTTRVRLEQSAGGLRLWKSDLVAVFWNSGALHGISGHVRSGVTVPSTAAIDASQALDIALASSANPTADAVQFADLSPQTTPFNRWTGPKAAVERGIDPTTLASVWRVDLPSGLYFIDEDSRSVMEFVSAQRDATVKTCTIRRPDNQHDTSGRVESIDTLCEDTFGTCTSNAECGAPQSTCSNGRCVIPSCLAANGGSGGTLVSNDTCTADESSGTCNFKMQLQPNSSYQYVKPVEDADDGSVLTVTESCTGANPAFTSAPNPNHDGFVGGDDMRQQSAFWGVSRDMFMGNAYLWSVIAPDNSGSHLSLYADYDNPDVCGGQCTNNGAKCHSNSDCSGGATCDATGAMCFTGGIYVDIHGSSALSILYDAWMHETGHFIIWTYGDLYYDCSQGSDEGGPVHETWADIFGELAAQRTENAINPDYGALLSFGGGQAPPPAENTSTNFSSPSYLLASSVNCSGDFHDQGQALEQALWEISFNRNCDKFNGFAACSDTQGPSTQTTTGSPDFPLWTSGNRTAMLASIGRAEAYAIWTAPYFGTTMAEVEAWFLDDIESREDSGTYSRVRAVLQQHHIDLQF